MVHTKQMCHGFIAWQLLLCVSFFLLFSIIIKDYQMIAVLKLFSQLLSGKDADIVFWICR